MDQDRNKYDLSFLAHLSGHIGRIQTEAVIPVEAGCSLEIDIDGITRLAPNRKEIVSECQVDTCAFFVPHRVVYGQDWVDFVDAGPDESKTFTGYPIPAQYRFADYLTLPTVGASINKALLQGYNRIHYNYYSVPSYLFNADNTQANSDPMNFEWFPTNEAGADNCRKYGRLAARLPHVLNGGNMTDASGQAGYEAQDLNPLDQQVPVTAGVFNLTDLAQIQSRYKTETQSAWFAHFYQDIMREKFGSDISADADPRNLRPTLLMRQTDMLSGTDIDGTDDATLGTFQGKTMERTRFHMPRKFFGEHGFVYILKLLRYPLVHVREVHPLLQKVDWTYDEVVGDPERLANLAPVQYDPSPWLAGGSTFPNYSYSIKEPYGQHYRFQNNRVHSNYQNIPGYPFSKWNGANPRDWYYYQDNEYAETFQTAQIGQWQSQRRVSVDKFSLVPGVTASIFAGT